MLRTCMIADYLRPYAQWRIDRPGPRNARAAIGLIDAAAYVAHLDESSRVIVRMAIAGCFALGRFNPGVEGEEIIRGWHYDDATGGPADLLEALAASAERGLQRRPAEAGSTPA
ncbi:hypothetical protein [Actinomadura meyerae]|nr:hypothetical protein [Actinomadura meyerae]